VQKAWSYVIVLQILKLCSNNFISDISTCLRSSSRKWRFNKKRQQENEEFSSNRRRRIKNENVCFFSFFLLFFLFLNGRKNKLWTNAVQFKITDLWFTGYDRICRHPERNWVNATKIRRSRRNWRTGALVRKIFHFFRNVTNFRNFLYFNFIKNFEEI